MRTKSKGVAILVGLVFAAVGVGVTAWGWSVLSNAKASVSWPSVGGRVISSSVERHTSSGSRGSSTTYGAEVQYDYTVDGTKYSADRVSFGDYSSSSPGHARGIVNRYPAGSEVSVHYDPARPDVAVLEPGTSWGAYMPLGIGLVFALVGTGLTVAHVVGKAGSAGAGGRRSWRREPPEVAEGP
jgi:hypothetical protein